MKLFRFFKSLLCALYRHINLLGCRHTDSVYDRAIIWKYDIHRYIGLYPGSSDVQWLRHVYVLVVGEDSVREVHAKSTTPHKQRVVVFFPLFLGDSIYLFSARTMELSEVESIFDSRSHRSPILLRCTQVKVEVWSLCDSKLWSQSYIDSIFDLIDFDTTTSFVDQIHFDKFALGKRSRADIEFSCIIYTSSCYWETDATTLYL